MKTCKYGCGGKMKKGGKVTGVKKMAKGGSSGPCPKGYHMNHMGICEENILHTLSSKIGVGVTGAGIAGLGIKKIADAVKKGKAIKEIKKANPAMTTKEARKKLASKDTEEKRKGGSVKKYAAGGSTIVGMPQYSNNPRTYSGRMLKEGGSFAPNRAVQSSCKGGMVRDANGKCVMSRSFKKGGSTFGMLSIKAGIDKNPRPTAADRIAGAKMSARKKK